MLDIVFALSVLVAVILFGALISIGNERQRQVIDGLRQQVARWAEGNLRLKRASLMREVHVPDPRKWLESTTARLLGIPPQLTELAPWESGGLSALVAPCMDGRKLVVTPVPPVIFIKGIQPRGSRRLAQAEVGLLGDRPRRLVPHEMNIVTCGAFFDLEAKLAWREVTGQALDAERLYLFEVPSASGR